MVSSFHILIQQWQVKEMNIPRFLSNDTVLLCSSGYFEAHLSFTTSCHLCPLSVQPCRQLLPPSGHMFEWTDIPQTSRVHFIRRQQSNSFTHQLPARKRCPLSATMSLCSYVTDKKKRKRKKNTAIVPVVFVWVVVDYQKLNTRHLKLFHDTSPDEAQRRQSMGNNNELSHLRTFVFTPTFRYERVWPVNSRVCVCVPSRAGIRAIISSNWFDEK